MRPVDLLLIHAPTTFYSPTGLTLHSMMAASVPSTPAMEMYPLGFLSIGEYLERNGYRVGICNLALLYSILPQIRPEWILRRVRARMVGIDLHWACTADGALETARILKREHPDMQVVMGGLTASCFWQELLAYPDVDFVVRGDSAEYPLLRLLAALDHKGALEDVPNLAWRDSDGEVRTTGLAWVPDDIDDYRTDYGWVIRSSASRLNPIYGLMSIPYRDWLANPSAAVITQKGCPHTCVMCGGSADAYRRICGRRRMGIRSPGAVARDVASAARLIRGPIFLVGDLQDVGGSYPQEVFRDLATLGMSNPMVIEVAHPTSFEFFQDAVRAAGSVILHMSPESHDEGLRRRFGRPYTNDALEGTIEAALAAGCRQVRLFFGIGLPDQDSSSVMDTVAYCGKLLDRFRRHGQLLPFISIFAPFIEPGSRAFTDPDRYGYTNLCTTLEDYRGAVRRHSWNQTLGYETSAMARTDLVEAAYKATLAMNRLYERSGLISSGRCERMERRLEKEEADRFGDGSARWLVGEASLSPSEAHLLPVSPHLFRPLGICRELVSGVRRGLGDLLSGV